jgi:uncharacterized protein (DUF3084 family)
MSNTPETDAFFFRTDIEWDDEVDFARKLERERDEARSELENMKETKRELMQMVYGRNWVEQDLRKERDEARQALADVEEYGTEEINAAVDLRQKLATALVEREELREQLNALREHRS